MFGFLGVFGGADEMGGAWDTGVCGWIWMLLSGENISICLKRYKKKNLRLKDGDTQMAF